MLWWWGLCGVSVCDEVDILKCAGGGREKEGSEKVGVREKVVHFMFTRD